jgi:uncharacterized membrane protein
MDVPLKSDIVNESSVERILASLLRSGVLFSAVTVIVGGVLNLLRHGREPVIWEKFHGEPASLRTLNGIADAALAAQGRGIIQLGLLLLVAVPVLRVAVSFVVFLRKRDLAFVGFTLCVLLVLAYSLFFAS